MKMPSKRQYDLVLDDGPDSKIPLHNEDAFQHGINFHAKVIIIMSVCLVIAVINLADFAQFTSVTRERLFLPVRI